MTKRVLLLPFKKTQRVKPLSCAGFTLIEILLVVIIIGILAGLVVPNLVGRGEETRIKGAEADINGGISAALDLYELDTGSYPEKIDDLVIDPGSTKGWRGPYVKKGLPKDPWGNPYTYKKPGSNNASSYDLSSAGPDGQHGTEDDVTNWKKSE
jgi:general secretion pathway protein G